MNDLKCIQMTTVFPSTEKRIELISFSQYETSFINDTYFETDRQYNKQKVLFGSVPMPLSITTRNPFNPKCITRRTFNFPISYAEAKARHESLNLK